eukprot:352246_1
MCLVCNNWNITDGYHVCPNCGQVKIQNDLMPQIILAINGSQKPIYNEYLANEFSQTELIKNDNEFALIETEKYPEFIFVKSSNPHKLCLQLWNDKVLNKFLSQTYLIQYAITNINYITTHPSLANDNIKILKLIGNKRYISMLAPLIPKEMYPCFIHSQSIQKILFWSF